MLKLNNQIYRRLAQAMQYSMQIPEGDALVFMVGKGNEKSNLEALETFIKETVLTLEDEVGVVMLPLLMDRLDRKSVV